MRIVRNAKLPSGIMPIEILPGLVNLTAVHLSLEVKDAERLAEELMSASEAARALEEASASMECTEDFSPPVIPKTCSVPGAILSMPAEGPVRLEESVKAPEVGVNRCSRCEKRIRPGAHFVHDENGGARHVIGSPECTK
jgi:hypothetical protein